MVDDRLAIFIVIRLIECLLPFIDGIECSDSPVRIALRMRAKAGTLIAL